MDHAIPLNDLSVRLTINGQTARFLFDTGAGAHTFARWFVDAAGMVIDDQAGIEAKDAVGESVALKAVHDVVGRLQNGQLLRLESAVVAEFPPTFEAEEIGGLLNPQLLATTDLAVVLDLRASEFRFERFDDAVRRTGAKTLSPEQFRVCIEAKAPVPNLRYAVVVAAQDKTAWLQLDTGTGITSLASDSPLLQDVRLEPGGQLMGVAGRRNTYSVAPDLQVSFAGFEASIDARVVETNYGDCGPAGLLGRDVLSRCALLFTEDALAIACT